MLQSQMFRPPRPGEPMVLAVFAYRYDAHLVPDLLENIHGAVHGYVAWDDRAASDTVSDEPTRRARLILAAQKLGADWILAADPDERFETGFATRLPVMLAQGRCNLWRFALHEMFSPTHYRTDGVWGGKSVMRLFPADRAAIDPAAAFHGGWVSDMTGLTQRDALVNLYHLRMASPLRRQLRRDLYAFADPDRKHQKIGYDYLADERGMVLEPVPADRAFLPAFVEDCGLWAPPPDMLGPLTPDPYETRMALASRSVRDRGRLAAHHVVNDLSALSPEDADLPLVAAQLALDAGAPDLALAVLARVPAERQSLGSTYLNCLAKLATGQTQAALATLSTLEPLAPGSPILAALRTEIARPAADFMALDAAWRHLAPGATCHEGARMARSDLAVIVIGFQNQPGLLPAVQSVLDQDEAAEVVVVNTGGGAVGDSLAPVLNRIRLITTDQPMYVGAARNIGIAASRAPYLAFLAADCLACPGWVSGRLARHRGGKDLVASAILPEPDAGLVALAASQLRYGTRHPDSDPRTRALYGLSYARSLLHQVGQFPPGLRVAEDTALNRLAQTFAAPVWAPDVATVHKEVGTLAAWLADERARGQRRAAAPPYRAFAADPQATARIAAQLAVPLGLATDFAARDRSLNGREKQALSAMQWLALRAGQQGVLHGLADITKANAMIAQAHAQQDPARAAQACSLDPQDPEKAYRYGRICENTGDLPQARIAYQAALALQPSHSRAAKAWIALTSTQQGAISGWHLAESLAMNAPQTRRLWLFAARAAQAAGFQGWAVVLGLRMLTLGLDDAKSHAAIGRLHQMAGNPLAFAFRRLTAGRLESIATPAGTCKAAG
jgi:tetratricopeptide (TPR) repeat protein